MNLSNAEINLLKKKVEKLEQDKAELMQWLEDEANKRAGVADNDLQSQGEALMETIEFINNQDK